MAFADLILGTLAPFVSYVYLYHHRYEKLSALDGKRRFLVNCSLFLHNHLHVFVDGVFEFCGFNIVREVLRHILAIQTPDNNSSNLQHFYFYGVVTQSAV